MGGPVSNISVAIIGGSGLSSFSEISDYLKSSGIDTSETKMEAQSLVIETPFSEESVTVSEFVFPDRSVFFLPRHGDNHHYPPHLIPSKAQLWALKELKVTQILASNAVGGISKALTSGTLVIPDQLIDYSWGREHTYFDGLNDLNNHIDFTFPYTKSLRQHLIENCSALGYEFSDSGVYACTQGPRLETIAEIKRLDNDGCAIVGMTGMPEAALARELGMEYASLCLVVNPAAGLSDQVIEIDEIKAVLKNGAQKVLQVLIATALKI